MATACTAISALAIITHAASATDKYTSYAELAAHEEEGIDYQRVLRQPGSSVAHIAIHGGAIEPPTAQLADHAAGTSDYAFYAFEGIKPAGNSDLHITSTNFDEPKVVEMLRGIRRTISWHGAAGDTPKTYVGGLDEPLAERIKVELRDAGFKAPAEVPPGIDGKDPRNIANRNASGAGVQLEITISQRRQFFKDGKLSRAWIEDPANRTAVFGKYVAAVNRALVTYGDGAVEDGSLP